MIKYYKIENFKNEDTEAIKNIIIRSRGLFSGKIEISTIDDIQDNSYLFKFCDANGKSDNLTTEKNEELLKEVKKEIKEINDDYEVREDKIWNN